MGARLARIASLAGCGLIAAAGAAEALDIEEAWPVCSSFYGSTEDCPHIHYVVITTDNGMARVQVSPSCGIWIFNSNITKTHYWGGADAIRDIINQTVNEAGTGVDHSSVLCIQTTNNIDEVTIEPAGGSCAESTAETDLVSREDFSPAVTLSKEDGTTSATLTGCRAHLHYEPPAEITDRTTINHYWGGINLVFADAYGYGDSYHDGYFYTVFDGDGYGAPMGDTWGALTTYESYRYNVYIRWQGGAAEPAAMPSDGGA